MILPQQAAPIPRADAGRIVFGHLLGIAPAGAPPAKAPPGKFWFQCPAAGGDMEVSRKKPDNPNAHIVRTKFECKKQKPWTQVGNAIEGWPRVVDAIALEEFDLHE